MNSKHLLLTFLLGMSLAISCFAWFLHGIGDGNGEAPMAGMAIGVALMIWAAVTGLVNLIKRRRKQSSAD
jgi:apolipoprotein N-acyltransferase